MSHASDMPRHRSRFHAGARAVQYVPRDLIGRGGMAEVWRGEALFEDGGSELVAIKRVRPGLEDAVFESMFEDEVRLGRFLVHPNIVRTVDAREVEGARSMIMELVDGDSLKGITDRATSAAPRVSLGQALYVMREVARGLAYAHGVRDEAGEPLRVIHRDVSPHNILLGRSGEVKLADFGLSDATTHRTARDPNLVGGKFGYLAPEVVKQKPSDHRVDVFALGIVLFETLAGRRLFHDEDDRETLLMVMRCEVPRLADVGVRAPERVQRLLDSLLHPDPDERLPSARAAEEEIELALDAVAEPAGAVPIAELVGAHLARIAASGDESERRLRDSESKELDPHGHRTSLTDVDEAEASRPSLAG